MSKKMTLNNLKSQDSKVFTKRKVIVDNYEFVIDEVFRPTKIQNLITEFISQQQYAESENLSFDHMVTIYILLIKHFTDIPVPSEYEKQIQMLNALVDLEYLETIMNSFNQGEVDKILKYMKKYANNLNELVNQLPEIQQEISEILPNESSENDQVL